MLRALTCTSHYFMLHAPTQGQSTRGVHIAPQGAQQPKVSEMSAL